MINSKILNMMIIATNMLISNIVDALTNINNSIQTKNMLNQQIG